MMDAPYYRKRAEAVRAEAARATYPEIRKQLSDIAEQYERMALQAEDPPSNDTRSKIRTHQIYDPPCKRTSE
jgi:hypothetical protein